jgi:hypothetical protein
VGIAALIISSTLVVGTATGGMIAFGIKARCLTLERTATTYTQIITPTPDVPIAALSINVKHSVDFGVVDIRLQTDEEADPITGDGPVIKIVIDVTRPQGLATTALSNPFAGSPPSCAIPNDSTCASSIYSYTEVDDEAQGILTIDIPRDTFVSGSGTCETSALTVVIPQVTIVQTSIVAESTTSKVTVSAPRGDVSGFPRFKSVDVTTQGGAVLIQNLFAVGGLESDDGFVITSGGGPVELNTIKAGPVIVNSGGGDVTVNSTLSLTFLTKVLADFDVNTGGGDLTMLGQVAGHNITLNTEGGQVVGTNIGAVFQEFLAINSGGGKVVASTFVSIGGENITIASGGGAVKLSAFATNALNVTTCSDAGQCGTANIAVLLLGLEPLSFEGISIPLSGRYEDQYIYVNSGNANQKHSAIGAKASAFAGNITGILEATSGRIIVSLQEALYLGTYDLVSDSGAVSCALENVPSPPQGEICSLGDCGHSTLFVSTKSGDIQMSAPLTPS